MFGARKRLERIEQLEKENRELRNNKDFLQDEFDRARGEFNRLSDKYCDMKKRFPFELGDIVFDLELRNEKGRYAKKNPSFEHSLINEVIVTKNNYFNLIERMENSDVFFDRESAEVILKKKCGIEA